MKSSKWEVVALGEMQQPGGVGATQDYNPVVDGPNPDAGLLDNAGNSPEQEAALETWVNMAVDMLNRHEPPEAVIAQLAHDGCPNPQDILQRAQQQPIDQQPVSDEIGQNPFETPIPQDGQTGQMQGLSQQPATMAKIRIAGKSWKVYASEMKYAGESASTVDGDAHPVSEIEKFIANMPVVEPSRPYIEARTKNIETARRAIRGIISKATYPDQKRLAALDTKLENEQLGLKEAAVAFDPIVDPEREAYLPRVEFRHNAFGTADPTILPYLGNVKEAALIWASESPYSQHSDLTDFQFSAMRQVEELGMSPVQASEFITTAQAALAQRKSPVAKTAAVVDNDGPADQLFI